MDGGCSSSTAHTKEKNRNYETCFYANACHVCKQYGKPLLQCGKCNMISYCCVKHEEQDKAEHREICNAIVEVIAEKHLIPDLNINFQNPEDWVDMRMNMFASILRKINRPLRIDERAMILFPRNCMVCHKQGDSLHPCEKCPSVSLCEQHKATHTCYDHKCELLSLCFEVDTFAGCPDLKYMTYLPVDIPYHEENGCSHFFRSYIEPKLRKTEDKIQLAIHTHLISYPLTFLYAAERINYDFNRNRNILCVHIVLNNPMEENMMEIWEIIFHYKSMLKYMKISIITEGIETRLPFKLKLCQKCKHRGNEMELSCHNMSYAVYMTMWFYTKPDFILGYNPRIQLNDMVSKKCGFDRDVTPIFSWLGIFKLLSDHPKCPVILTSVTKKEAINDAEEITNFAVRPIIFRTLAKPNPFASLRPCRDSISELPVYPNSFVTICEHRIS